MLTILLYTLVTIVLVCVFYRWGYKRGLKRGFTLIQLPEVSDSTLEHHILMEIHYAIDRGLSHVGPFYFEKLNTGDTNINGFKNDTTNK